MTGINYSKWDHIEISDDEDDTHPNVDTASLFRWRHQARVEKMAEAKKEKETLEKGKTEAETKLIQTRNRLNALKLSDPSSDELKKLETEVEMLARQQKEYEAKEEEIHQKEKKEPLNIDTICHEGKSKTIINKDIQRKDRNLTDEEVAKEQSEFFDKHEKQIKKFGMFRKYEDSQTYLEDHKDLVSEYTANYLVLWCINLEVEEKHELMTHVARQCIVMQFILELAKSLDVDPRSCLRAFFSKIKLGEKQYMDAFNEEYHAFMGRIQTRAQARIDEAVAEYEAEERQKRLGPGGLDPVEVFETLPQPLQECFENKDLEKLQSVIETMPREQAEYHLDRCVKSGMWIPDGNKAKAESEAATGEDQGAGGDAMSLD